MADQDFLQDETLFDDMAEQSEARFLELLVEDLFLEDGVGVIFKEMADVVADVVENSEADSHEKLGAEMVPAMRSHLHKVFKEMELGDDMLMAKSSDKELRTAISQAFHSIGSALA